MTSFLKDHPFAVEAFFEHSFVITFAIPKEQVQELIPECLELDVFNEKWAFVAIAMVRTRGLRPKGFPAFFGNDFFLIGHRIFVKYRSTSGKRLRGLYILKSETDKKKMEFFGNIFTHYNYTTTDIEQSHTEGQVVFKSIKSDFRVEIAHEGDIALPPHSPFTDWREARKFAGPLPFTFTYNALKKEVLIIEGVRQDWVPQPVRIIDYHFSFLQSPAFDGALLANAFVINNVPYHWKKGKVERWDK